VHLGVLLRHLGPHTDVDAVRAAARSADILGYHSLWAVDPRLAPSPMAGGPPSGLAPVAALIEAAACTERVQLGLHLSAGHGNVSGSDPSALAELPPALARRLTVALDVGDLGIDGSAPDGRTSNGAGFDAGPDDAAVLTALRAMRPRVRSVLLSTRSPDRWGRFAALVDGWFLTSAPHGHADVSWRTVVTAAVADAFDATKVSLVVRADVVLADRPLSRHRSTFCGSVEQVVDDLLEVETMGANVVVLAVARCRHLDEVLGGYAAIAEGLELRSSS